MPKISEEPLTAIQVRLYDSDLAALKRLYGQSVGVNKAIRTMVRTFIRQIDAAANKAIDEAEAANPYSGPARDGIEAQHGLNDIFPPI